MINLPVRWGGMGDFNKLGGDPSNGEWFWKEGRGGGDTLLRTMAPEKMQHSRKGPVKVELKEH